MFLIANSRRGEITISDLGISLNPRQALDLHKIKSPEEINNSQNLKSAIASGAIKVLHKDEIIIKQEKQEVIVQNSFDKNELLNDIKDLLSKEVDDKLKEITNTNNDKLLTLLQSIQENLSKNSTSIVEKKEITGIENISVNADKIIEMHSKAMEKLSKNVEVNIISPEEKVIDKNVSNNADELDNLI